MLLQFLVHFEILFKYQKNLLNWINLDAYEWILIELLKIDQKLTLKKWKLFVLRTCGEV